MEDSGKIQKSGLPTPIFVYCVSGEEKSPPTDVKVYKRRWFMLSLFILNSICIMSQFSHYTVISNVMMRYYNVTIFGINSTVMIPMLNYIIFIIPFTYVLRRISLRWAMVIGSLLCCAGGWIKVLSVSPDRFPVTLLGHCIMALSAIIMIPLPGQLAANWFASDEVSKATSFGLLGQSFGMAISCLIPPALVKNHENISDIGADINVMFSIAAVASTLNFLLIGLFFQKDPELPPSKARALQQNCSNEEQQDYRKSIKNLLTNRNFIILCQSYGLILGVQSTAGAMFNQLLLAHFKDAAKHAGMIGALVTFIGMPGSIFFAIVLDRTHRFKELAVIVYCLTMAFQVLAATSVLKGSLWMVYVTSLFLGFSISGFVTIGYETAAEYTYPVSETLSGGILNITNNLYGMLIVLLGGGILERFGDPYVHVWFFAILSIGLILTLIMKDDCRRQAAQMKDTSAKSDVSSESQQAEENISKA